MSKAEAVEKNRSGLEELLRQLIQHPTLRTDPHVIEFLCLTPANPASSSSASHSRGSTSSSSHSGSAFARPAARHSTDDERLDDADAVDAARPPETAVRNGGRWSESPAQPPGPAPHDGRPAQRAAGVQQACSEPRGTVWIGGGDFPAP